MVRKQPSSRAVQFSPPFPARSSLISHSILSQFPASSVTVLRFHVNHDDFHLRLQKGTSCRPLSHFLGLYTGTENIEHISYSIYTVAMTMLYIYSILSVSLLYFSILVKCFPDPGSCAGECGYVHDPYVVRRDDGTYFRFVTFKDIQIASAPSIKGPWRGQGSVLPSGSMIPLPGNDSLWVSRPFIY